VKIGGQVAQAPRLTRVVRAPRERLCINGFLTAAFQSSQEVRFAPICRVRNERGDI